MPSSNKKLIIRAVSVVMSLFLIYLGFYVIGEDKDKNGKKIPGSDDQIAKVMNIVMRFVICVAAVLILVAGWKSDKFLK
jgi:cobalamin biosynthesis protein CobD/CbiB